MCELGVQTIDQNLNGSNELALDGSVVSGAVTAVKPRLSDAAFDQLL